MATALQLTAQATIINGQGLAPSANLLAQISSFQNHSTVHTVANIWQNVFTANDASLASAVSSLGSNVYLGLWLLDLYPSNVSAACSVGPQYYDSAYASTVPSFSNTLLAQARAPFANGMSEFANVYGTASSLMLSSFDTVASINILQNRTYGQSGLGYTGPADLATNGLGGNVSAVIADTVTAFGTMYDVNNMANIGDPYVFGQNIINQGLGNYGNIIAQCRAAGLNTRNLQQIPTATTVTSQQASTTATSTPIGQVQLPTITNVTTTTAASGTSLNVMQNIYQSVSGSDLQAIVTATQTTVSNVSITTLADYLNFNKVFTVSQQANLAYYGVNDFASLGRWLQSRIGSGYFANWNAVVNLMANLSVPSQTYTTTTGNTPVLSAGTISTLSTSLATGSGPFNNAVISDFLGATAGMPYTVDITALNNYYSSVDTATLNSDLATLDSRVVTYMNGAIANTMPSLTPVVNAVNAVNAYMNSAPFQTQANLVPAQTAYTDVISHLNTEVSNLHKAGVVFNSPGSGYPSLLSGFAQSFSQAAAGRTQFQTNQFFANLITNDTAGDTLRAAVAENINTVVLGTGGIILNNDAQPAAKIAQAAALGIPLSTYLTQNQ